MCYVEASLGRRPGVPQHGRHRNKERQRKEDARDSHSVAMDFQVQPPLLSTTRYPTPGSCQTARLVVWLGHPAFKASGAWA
jgi:hypothetical protein